MQGDTIYNPFWLCMHTRQWPSLGGEKQPFPRRYGNFWKGQMRDSRDGLVFRLPISTAPPGQGPLWRGSDSLAEAENCQKGPLTI